MALWLCGFALLGPTTPGEWRKAKKTMASRTHPLKTKTMAQGPACSKGNGKQKRKNGEGTERTRLAGKAGNLIPLH